LLGFCGGFGGGGGGTGGTGSVPIATNVGLPADGEVPATIRRTDTAVRTTSSASSNVTIRFFIRLSWTK